MSGTKAPVCISVTKLTSFPHFQARSTGLDAPSTLLARADEVIAVLVGQHVAPRGDFPHP